MKSSSEYEYILEYLRVFVEYFRVFTRIHKCTSMHYVHMHMHTSICMHGHASENLRRKKHCVETLTASDRALRAVTVIEQVQPDT